MKITSETVFVAIAATGVAVAGAACSGGPDTSAEARQQPQEAQSQTATAELVTAEFRVEGMTCGGCALATEMSVEELDGVTSADAEYDEATGEGRCSVTYDPSTVNTDRIAGAIEEAGFTPTLEGTNASS